jgi:Rrf2 family nitric oxide-sensitive transcriptional repressor
MRLTVLSDYALRLLMYAADHDRLVTIEEAAASHGISRAHLMKVANLLTRAGYLKAVRGRSGGLTLAKAPADIGLGAVLRMTEPDFSLVECFATGNQCVISRHCKLPKIVNAALANFLATFDRFTLDDLIAGDAQTRHRTAPNERRHRGIVEGTKV